MVIECKAPEVDISCDDVREQAERYRNILKADYIMLVNGYKIIMYKYQDGNNFELVDISSYKELLESKVSFGENIPLEPYSYEEIISYETQKKFTKIYVGCETPKPI